MLHELIVPNSFTRIFPDGNVMQSYRVTLLLSCPMNLRYYPLDVQVCPVSLATYGMTTKEAVLYWRENNPVQMARDLFNLPRFTMTNNYTEESYSVTTTGTYSCLK